MYLPSHLNTLRQPVSPLPNIIQLPNKPPAMEKKSIFENISSGCLPF